jgi:hypothetical protein
MLYRPTDMDIYDLASDEEYVEEFNIYNDNEE